MSQQPFGFVSTIVLLVICSSTTTIVVNGQLTAQNPRVTLNYCTVIGKEYSLQTTITQSYTILAFYGVPYAMPPVDNYRLRVKDFACFF